MFASNQRTRAAVLYAGISDAGQSVSPGHESARTVCDYIVDPLANIDLEPLRRALETKEIVLHGADYDLRMLRRGLKLVAAKSSTH